MTEADRRDLHKLLMDRCGKMVLMIPTLGLLVSVQDLEERLEPFIDRLCKTTARWLGR